jgi:hypothetical protein
MEMVQRKGQALPKRAKNGTADRTAKKQYNYFNFHRKL